VVNDLLVGQERPPFPGPLRREEVRLANAELLLQQTLDPRAAQHHAAHRLEGRQRDARLGRAAEAVDRLIVEADQHDRIAGRRLHRMGNRLQQLVQVAPGADDLPQLEHLVELLHAAAEQLVAADLLPEVRRAGIGGGRLEGQRGQKVFHRRIEGLRSASKDMNGADHLLVEIHRHNQGRSRPRRHGRQRSCSIVRDAHRLAAFQSHALHRREVRQAVLRTVAAHDLRLVQVGPVFLRGEHQDRTFGAGHTGHFLADHAQDVIQLKGLTQRIADPVQRLQPGHAGAQGLVGQRRQTLALDSGAELGGDQRQGVQLRQAVIGMTAVSHEQVAQILATAPQGSDDRFRQFQPFADRAVGGRQAAVAGQIVAQERLHKEWADARRQRALQRHPVDMRRLHAERAGNLVAKINQGERAGKQAGNRFQCLPHQVVEGRGRGEDIGDLAQDARLGGVNLRLSLKARVGLDDGGLRRHDVDQPDIVGGERAAIPPVGDQQRADRPAADDQRRQQGLADADPTGELIQPDFQRHRVAAEIVAQPAVRVLPQPGQPAPGRDGHLNGFDQRRVDAEKGGMRRQRRAGGIQQQHAGHLRPQQGGDLLGRHAEQGFGVDRPARCQAEALQRAQLAVAAAVTLGQRRAFHNHCRLRSKEAQPL